MFATDESIRGEASVAFKMNRDVESLGHTSPEISGFRASRTRQGRGDLAGRGAHDLLEEARPRPMEDGIGAERLDRGVGMGLVVIQAPGEPGSRRDRRASRSRSDCGRS